MITNHAKALGIGAAVMLSTAFGAVQAQSIPANVARPLNAAANVLTGGQAGYAAPYGYAANGVPYQPAAPAAPTYYAPNSGGWTTAQPGYAPVQQVQPAYPGYAPAQPTYPGYAPAQPTYPTNYYQSGYNGYTQPQATQYRTRPGTRNPVVNAVRSVVQPQRYTYPAAAAPGYAPTYAVPR